MPRRWRQSLRPGGMRAVVDTNILVSGLLRADGPPGRVLAAISSGRLVPVVCDAILDEYRLVLPRPRLGLPRVLVDEFLRLMAEVCDGVPIPAHAGQPPMTDPSDWPFVACALAADCPVVTGNAKHFPATLGVRVMTASEWVAAHG